MKTVVRFAMPEAQTGLSLCFSKKAKETMLSPRKTIAGHFMIGGVCVCH